MKQNEDDEKWKEREREEKTVNYKLLNQKFERQK